jgi:hypothetical protein
MVPSARDAPLLDSEYVVAGFTAFGFGTELRGRICMLVNVRFPKTATTAQGRRRTWQ